MGVIPLWVVEISGPDVDDDGNPGSHTWYLCTTPRAKQARRLMRRAKAKRLACRMLPIRHAQEQGWY